MDIGNGYASRGECLIYWSEQADRYSSLERTSPPLSAGGGVKIGLKVFFISWQKRRHRNSSIMMFFTICLG
jgi:hypothetical protein